MNAADRFCSGHLLSWVRLDTPPISTTLFSTQLIYRHVTLAVPFVGSLPLHQDDLSANRLMDGSLLIAGHQHNNVHHIDGWAVRHCPVRLDPGITHLAVHCQLVSGDLCSLSNGRRSILLVGFL